MNVPTTFRSPITDSITADEMSRLRDEGLSNIKIAERCGVSVTTVYRLIGKQGFRAGAHRDTQVSSSEPAPIAEMPRALPSQPTRLKPSKLGFAGEAANYEIDLVHGTLTARGDTVELTVDHEGLKALILELMEAEQMIEPPTVSESSPDPQKLTA